MEGLLDTHVLVWWFEDAAVLSRRGTAMLASPENAFYVSAAVGWEVAMKVNSGKLRSRVSRGHERLAG